MNNTQPNEASRYLLALAQRNSRVYASHPNTRAIIVTGSVAEGMSDFYSDLDMIVYYDKLPSEDDLFMAFQQNQGTERRPLGERSGEEAGESYKVRGVECQVGHTTIAAWERDIATVLEQLNITSQIQKSLSGMIDALPLYGAPLVRQWQARIADYPEALRLAMVKHYLSFFPIWGIQERLAVRDGTVWFYQVLVEAAYHILGVLAGLNRRYYSSFQFKRMHRFIEQMAIVPTNLGNRLEAIFHADPSLASAQLEELVRETVSIVDSHLPTVDTTRVRQWIGWRQQPWEHSTFAS